MVKIDFGKKTVQLWPDEYSGYIKISSTTLSYTTPQGTSTIITLPSNWFDNIDKRSHLTTFPVPNPALSQENPDIHIVEGSSSTVQDLEARSQREKFTFKEPDYLSILESMSIEQLKKRISEQMTNFTNINKVQEENASNLDQLGEKFGKNMGMIKNFINEIQDFVNKVERRVLRLEHVVLPPLDFELHGIKKDTQKFGIKRKHNFLFCFVFKGMKLITLFL